MTTTYLTHAIGNTTKSKLTPEQRSRAMANIIPMGGALDADTWRALPVHSVASVILDGGVSTMVVHVAPGVWTILRPYADALAPEELAPLTVSRVWLNAAA